MRLTLTDEEATLLRDVLQQSLGELRGEIAGTDSSFFRERLRENEEGLKAILERLTRRRARGTF